VDSSGFTTVAMRFDAAVRTLTTAADPAIPLRVALRPLYAFTDKNSVRRFFRFRPPAQVREAKALLAPEVPIRNVTIFHGGVVLANDTRFAKIGSSMPFDWTVAVPPVVLLDDLGEEMAMKAGEDPKLQVKRSCEFLVLGEAVPDVKAGTRAPVRLGYRPPEFRFEKDGIVTARAEALGTRFSQLSAAFGGAKFAVNGLIKREDETLASVPRGSIITVLPVVQTVADLRRSEPGRWVFRYENTIFPGSAAAVPGITKMAAEQSPPRDFAIGIPGKALQSLRFDFETTVADVRKAITDAFKVNFPPYALFANDFILSDDEFLFDVCVCVLNVRPQPGRPNVYRVFSENQEQEISGSSVAELRRKIAPSFPQPVDLISGGKVLFDGASLADARVFSDRFVYVCQQLPPAESFGDGPVVFTTFDFMIAGTRGNQCSLPFTPKKTVAQAKSELGKKLGKRAAELSVIDTVQLLCLEDSVLLATFIKPGRPFTVGVVDKTIELKEDQLKVVKKFAPNKKPAEAKLLYLQCLGHPVIFQNTCKQRGFT
jgi:hypothetical protein